MRCGLLFDLPQEVYETMTAVAKVNDTTLDQLVRQLLISAHESVQQGEKNEESDSEFKS